MKTLLARYKKLFGFVGVLALTVSLAVSASAFTRSYTTSRYSSASPANYDNSTFYLKTEYHVGSQLPWDDAYLYAEAGATPGNLREVYCKFEGNSKTYDATYSLFGSGVQCMNTGYMIDGKDSGTGVCWARTYSGSSIDDSVTNYQHLTVQ